METQMEELGVSNQSRFHGVYGEDQYCFYDTLCDETIQSIFLANPYLGKYWVVL